MTSRAFLRLLLISGAPLMLSAEDERPVVDDSREKKDAPVSALPTLWIAGDSTVKNNQGQMRGWGQDIGSFLDETKIQVVNRAIGGRSSRTFFTEGRWDEMLAAIKPGDIVLVQFGHNDVGPLDARGKFRGSIKGIGDETEQVTQPDGSIETVRSYGWYLKHFARTAKAKSATVVLCSPVPHKKFEGDWKEWRGWVKDCAAEEGVLFLDLTELIASRYAAMDRAKVDSFFADERTHTNAEGAAFNARAVIDGLKALPESPLAKYLRTTP